MSLAVFLILSLFLSVSVSISFYISAPFSFSLSLSFRVSASVASTFRMWSSLTLNGFLYIFIVQNHNCSKEKQRRNFLLIHPQCFYQDTISIVCWIIISLIGFIPNVILITILLPMKVEERSWFWYWSSFWYFLSFNSFFLFSFLNVICWLNCSAIYLQLGSGEKWIQFQEHF